MGSTQNLDRKWRPNLAVVVVVVVVVAYWWSAGRLVSWSFGWPARLNDAQTLLEVGSCGRCALWPPIVLGETTRQ